MSIVTSQTNTQDNNVCFNHSTCTSVHPVGQSNHLLSHPSPPPTKSNKTETQIPFKDIAAGQIFICMNEVKSIEEYE